MSDEIDEGEETALFTFVNLVNAQTETVSIPLTLLDRNERPALSVSSQITPENVADGGLIFTLSLSHPSSTPVRLRYATSDQSLWAGKISSQQLGSLSLPLVSKAKPYALISSMMLLFEG